MLNILNWFQRNGQYNTFMADLLVIRNVRFNIEWNLKLHLSILYSRTSILNYFWAINNAVALLHLSFRQENVWKYLDWIERKFITKSLISISPRTQQMNIDPIVTCNNKKLLKKSIQVTERERERESHLQQ